MKNIEGAASANGFEVPKIETQVRDAFVTLLPLAIRDVCTPSEAPLRWSEKEINPIDLSVYANPDGDGSRTIKITRHFVSNVWGVSAREPVGDDRSRYTETNVTIRTSSPTSRVRVEASTYEIGPGNELSRVSYEGNSGMESNRKEGLLSHLGGLLTGASLTMPEAQRRYMAKYGSRPGDLLFSVSGSSSSGKMIHALTGVDLKNTRTV